MSTEYKWINDVLDAIKREETEKAAKSAKLAEHGSWLGLALMRLEKAVDYLDGKYAWTDATLRQYADDIEASRRMIKWAKEQGLL